MTVGGNLFCITTKPCVTAAPHLCTAAHVYVEFRSATIATYMRGGTRFPDLRQSTTRLIGTLTLDLAEPAAPQRREENFGDGRLWTR